MRKCKLLILLLATLFATTNLWADPTAMGDGTGLAWEYAEGTLTITYDGSGTGVMPDYTATGAATRMPWYSNRTSIATVVLPEGLTHIGDYAFSMSTNSSFLTVTIPSTVTSIGTGAFNTKLTTVNVLPTTPPTLGSNAIKGAASMKVFVPSAQAQDYSNAWLSMVGKLYIDANTPAPIPHLTGDCGASGNNLTYDITNYVLTISGTGAMQNYGSANDRPWKDIVKLITNINLGANVTTIGDFAFKGFTGITSVTLPSGLTSIGGQAFSGCNNAAFTSLTFPSTITYIGNDAFFGVGNMYEIYMSANPENLTWIDGNKDDFFNNPTFPDVHTQCYVPAGYLTDYQAKWNTGDKDVDVNVTFVAEEAAITEGDFGVDGDNLHWSYADNVLTITGSGATGEEGEGLGYAGENQPWKTFNSDIQIIYLPDGITYIGADDFFEMDNVVKVYLGANPQGLTWDEDGDDMKEEKATICYVPDIYKTTYIAKFPEVNVTFMRESDEPGDEPAEPNGLSWTLVGGVLTFSYDGAGTGIMDDYERGTAPWYENKNSITSIILPHGMTHIGDYAFYNCSNTSLTSIAIPSTVTSIGTGAFYFCSRLTSLSLPTGLTELGANAFNGCTRIASPITIPAGVTTIPDGAFTGCSAIPSVTLHSGVTTIELYAFFGCDAFESVTIPANVAEIGISAFWGCENLTSVTCLPTTAPTVGKNAFTNCHENLVITYQNGSDQDYANKFLQYWDILRNASTSIQPSLPHLSGTFSGGTLTWDLSFTGSTGTLLEHDGTLAITGSGAMDDYDWSDNVWAPWHDYADFINHVNIASGVTKIGKSAFSYMEHVNTFIIPASVTYIGGDAFFHCNNDEMIVYSYANPANLEWHDNVPAYEGVGWVPDDFQSLTRGPWGNSVFVSQATKCVVPSNYLDGYKAKWARGGDYKWWDLNVWFASELQDGESAEYINNALNELDGKVAPVVTLVRPLNRDGYFASLCLPFNMSASQIAESSLHSAEIKEFTNASIVGDELYIEFTPVDHIEAGKPYFVKYTDPAALGDALDRLDFMEVTIDKTAPVAVTHGGLTMTGTYVPMHVEAQTDASGVLFLGPENQLFWPSQAGNIKPFRAFFQITGGANNAPRKGMPARIVEKEQITTALENTDAAGKYTKTLENSMLVIEKNGVRYNVQGQIVK